MLRRPRPLLGLLAVLALLSVACAKESDEPVVSDTTATSDRDVTPDPIDWDDCGAVDCATLEVPLDYDEPDGEQIEIYMARHRAERERKGVLFVNPGGPGASAAELAELLPGLLPAEISERFDIIGVDPRGVGGSTPLECGVDPAELYGVDSSIDSLEDREALLEVSQRYADDCAKRYGDRFAHMGTRDVARDMDTVRAALGEDQISYLGFSYGTAIGQVYAGLFPERVRSMVLDGVLELGPTGLELADDQAAGFETALDRFVEFCDGDEGCAIEGKSLETVEDVLAMAEEPGGIPAPDADRPAGPGEVTLGISWPLYSQSRWGDLDSALSAARGGDGSELVALADEYHSIAEFEIYFAVNCLDFAWPTGDPDAFLTAAKATASVSPHFGEALVNDYIRCVGWPAAPDPLEAVEAPGAPPILVISTTGDPATPYQAGVAVAETLLNGILITNEGEGHTVVADGKPCIDRLVIAYLVDDVIPEDGTVCD